MFNDPVLRCRECQAIISVKYDVKILGKCHLCGDNRSKRIMLLSQEEMHQLEDEYGYDHPFLLCFDPRKSGNVELWERNYFEEGGE